MHEQCNGHRLYNSHTFSHTGKDVTTGHMDGSISHYKAEKGDLYLSSAPGSGPHSGASIVHLTWVEAQGSNKGGMVGQKGVG